MAETNNNTNNNNEMPRVRVVKHFFKTKEDVEADVIKNGFKSRPLTSPVTENELPFHYHPVDIVTYALAGKTYFLTGDGEKLQVEAKETLLLSEARLRETLSRGPSSYTFSDDAHLVAAGMQPGASSTSLSGVQLWWLELAQQIRGREYADGRDPVTQVDDQNYPSVGQQLIDGAARIEQLEQHSKEQGTEVVFLRQEIIARDIELRRVREDASERQLAAQRRVTSLEQAVRTQSLDGATKIRELETAVRTLSRRSDVHGALAEARQQIAAERVQAIHREGELEVLRKMLEGEQQQHQLALGKAERLQLATERISVAKSEEDVPGADPLTLIEHFAGIAELQAVRIRELSEALAG